MTIPTTEPELTYFINELTDEIFIQYPEKLEAHPIRASRDGVRVALGEGADPDDLLKAARNYRIECEREGYIKRYRIGIPRFYADRIWRRYLHATVYGRTREEWARSGQDLAEFDRLAAGIKDEDDAA